MDEILSIILHGCQIARDLDANIHNIANQPRYLRTSCEEVAAAFNDAVSRLRAMDPTSRFDAVPAMNLLGAISMGEGEGPSDPFYFRRLTEERGVDHAPELGLEILAMTSGGGSMGFGDQVNVGVEVGTSGGSVGGGEMLVRQTEASGSGRTATTTGSSVQQRSSRKRKDSAGTRTTRVPAPRTGNLEIPPDDGYTWRKYGQKDILGARFPRSYYRCTHKSFYGCEAKKQVQRLDEDPFTYEVTYCGDHSCQTSTTPLVLPAIAPPHNIPMTQGKATTMPMETMQILQSSTSSLSTSIHHGNWPRNSPGGEGGSGAGTAGGIAGTSQQRGGRDVDSVADLAAAMFNSSGSGSSIDAFFPSKRNK